MNSIFFNASPKRRVSQIMLEAALGFFIINSLIVLFGRGINVHLGWFSLKSTTIEFPVIAAFSALLLLLLARGLLKETILLVVAVAMTLIAVEVFLRVFDHPLSRPYVDYSNWYEPSDLFGHRLVPNFEGVGPLNVPVKVNSAGFRDSEHVWEKPAGTIRILGLGDSFLFGWGVSQDDVFLKRLESLLGQEDNARIETINSGVPGWGLNQYYLYMKQFGVRYNPDIVVLAYFTDDLNNGILESIPSNEQYRGGLRYKGGTLHHSRLYNFIKSLSDKIREKNRVTRVDYLHNFDVRRAEWAKRENYLMTKNPNEEQYEHLLDEYLARIKRTVSDAGGILVVMYIPDIAQIHHPEAQNINRLLVLHTQQQGIPFVDMTPVFEQANGYETYYLHPNDAHTNEAGHLAMAKALANLICKAAPKDLLKCQCVLQ